ncbi:MAG: HprK-related kinase A [Pelomonas sp.]|nr:HprK-related kinase A [Roseateles sp.]
MKVGELSARELGQALRGPGLRVATGPFQCRFGSDIAAVGPELARLYAEHELVAADDSFIDFHVRVASSGGLRRWIRPQALFSVDAVTPFSPLPRSQALAMLEWGLNWCVTAYCHHQLVLHAACVARAGRAMILPAPPGSGKSTLTAALVHRGWRLLSDELTLVDYDAAHLNGTTRPVNLKNDSIGVIARFAPEAVLSRPMHDTSKGTVALMAPPPASVRAAAEPAVPAWIVLPRWRAGASARLTPLEPGAAFMQLAENAMNYHLLGATGFEALGRLVDRCEAWQFEYGELDEAIAALDAFAPLGPKGAA